MPLSEHQPAGALPACFLATDNLKLGDHSGLSPKLSLLKANPLHAFRLIILPGARATKCHIACSVPSIMVRISHEALPHPASSQCMCSSVVAVTSPLLHNATFVISRPLMGNSYTTPPVAASDAWRWIMLTIERRIVIGRSVAADGPFAS